jgi:hypothetical protein
LEERQLLRFNISPPGFFPKPRARVHSFIVVCPPATDPKERDRNYAYQGTEGDACPPNVAGNARQLVRVFEEHNPPIEMFAEVNRIAPAIIVCADGFEDAGHQ